MVMSIEYIIYVLNLQYMGTVVSTNFKIEIYQKLFSIILFILSQIYILFYFKSDSI